PPGLHGHLFARPAVIADLEGVAAGAEYRSLRETRERPGNRSTGVVDDGEYVAETRREPKFDIEQRGCRVQRERPGLQLAELPGRGTIEVHLEEATDEGGTAGARERAWDGPPPGHAGAGGAGDATDSAGAAKEAVAGD